MQIENYLKTLNDDEVAQVRKVLSEPHLEKETIGRTFQQRRFFILSHLIKILGDDEKTQGVLSGIRVNEELKRIRNGSACATNLPENYLKAISDAFGKWGVVSFYRGRWEIRNPDLSENLPEISMRHIYAGSVKLQKKFKKDFLDEKTLFLLEGQWERIKNSYDAMFNKNVSKNYYEREAEEEERRRFA